MSVKPMSQTVSYTARAIDSVADIVDALNISSGATISYGSIKLGGGTSLIRENTVNESDINFIVSVKVTNEAPVSFGHMEFRPIPGLDADHFPAVYGDSFIAGFLEGGEFSAIISIKVDDKSKISRVKMAAEVQLLPRSLLQPFSSSALLDKDKEDIWKGTELSISVSWAGGGEIKKPTANWDLSTVIAAANEFPSQVLKHSQKILAILMNYNSLRSFHETNTKLDRPYIVLDYRLCDLYTADLLSAFMAYKALWKKISKMMKDPERYEAREPSDEVPDPIKCDVTSLNIARTECRKGMTIILEETKLLATRPEIGSIKPDGTMREPPYRFPGELEARLPVCKSDVDNCGSSSPSSGETLAENSYVAHVSRNFSRARPVEPPLPSVGRGFYSVDGNSHQTDTNAASRRRIGNDSRHLSEALRQRRPESHSSRLRTFIGAIKYFYRLDLVFFGILRWLKLYERRKMKHAEIEHRPPVFMLYNTAQPVPPIITRDSPEPDTNGHRYPQNDEFMDGMCHEASR
ncbi:hypothetical protein DTO282F9_3403 [Paecilomyces variotii]|nr:hypothetical protein DTO282F9_3403 [Paecilomyces variotii]